MLISGGIAVAYLAQWYSLTWKGLMQTPKKPWSLSLDNDGSIIVATPTARTIIPASAVSRLIYIYDDNWDQMKGMEDSGLVIRLKSGSRINVPGSSIGFAETLVTLRAHHNVESQGIE